MSLRDAALLLLGHGSTLNADSSAPTYQHAEEIRRRNIFAEVHVGFWKEEPNFRQALRQTNCPVVYVVPNFISSGYFTEQIIPRELGLTGPISQVEGKTVYYCQPVGLSGESMTDVLLKRAREVVANSTETCDPAKTCLFICGHGTSMNDNSTKIIHEQAAAIRAKGIYADCQPVLMEQRPFVKDWRTLTDCPDVIVVPFFISDGLHSFEDIPVLLGMTHNVRQKGFTNPHREGGRRLWYATAIGTEQAIADVIVECVDQFNEKHNPQLPSTSERAPSYIRRHLKTLFGINSMQFRMGQVLIEHAWTDFEIFHVNDEETPRKALRELKSFAELHEIILRNEKGEFRPLRAAPDLPQGWIMFVQLTERDLEDIEEIFNYVYPAEIANALLWRYGNLSVTPWRETAERQTGRFRVVREMDDAGIKELAAQVCDRDCLKRRLWSPCAQPVEEKPHEIPLLCPEACNYFVSKAREKLKGADEEEV